MSRKLDKTEIDELFADIANDEAKRVCGQGQCYACFNCGHTNKVSYQMKQLGKGDKCPIESYGVEPDTRSFAERLEAGETFLSGEDEIERLFAICARCEHADVVENGDNYELELSDETYADYCRDCPVAKAREGIEENMAEARMS